MMGLVPHGSLLAFILGLCVGSFLNVCIYRLPRRVSVVRPRSACPSCLAPLNWYDNVPVLSFVLLRGRCRRCRNAISWQYPLVELTTGFLFWVVARQTDAGGMLVYHWSWVSLLLVVTVVDLRHQIIPDVITIPGLMLALLVRAAGGGSLADGLIGLAVGGGSLYLVGWLYYRATGVEGMGGGDIKLMAMVGAALGWQGSLVVIFFGSALGAATGLMLLILRRAGRRTALPFGSFLAPTAVGVLLGGSGLAEWYRGLVG